jgi:hypothetical protein
MAGKGGRIRCVLMSLIEGGEAEGRQDLAGRHDGRRSRATAGGWG